MEGQKQDQVSDYIATGQHYKQVCVPSWAVGQPLDPFLIAEIFRRQDEALSAPQITILKKTLALGKRGHKSPKQDFKDIVGAADRAIELEDAYNDN